MEIYESPVISALREIYAPIIQRKLPYQSLKEQLQLFAERLQQAYHDQHTIACIEINNNHPDYLGQTHEFLFECGLQPTDFQKTIANEYGFDNWDNIPDKPVNWVFEDAVNLLLDGDYQQLNSLLQQHPELVKQTSDYGHGASLLHYTAANGVEIWRQRIPLNLIDMVQLLLDHGADTSATMQVYNGQHTALQLMETSAHPWAAGIDKKILDLLA
ncbi:MAG: hypothetical protein MRY78_05160 [Saprospiraceae bacterium]|nr:hypothetical protein [Saprospiraceae bacterium]